MPAGWKQYSDNHQRFVACRRVFLLFHLEPENAFSLRVKSLHRNVKVPKDILKEIKCQQWYNCPDELEGALNWKAYASECFLANICWPDVDSIMREPNLGY